MVIISPPFSITSRRGFNNKPALSLVGRHGKGKLRLRQPLVGSSNVQHVIGRNENLGQVESCGN
jgi:hypothetical protein